MAVAAGGLSWLLVQTALVEVNEYLVGLLGILFRWPETNQAIYLSVETKEQMDEQQKAFLPLNVDVVPHLTEATEHTVISVKCKRGEDDPV